MCAVALHSNDGPAHGPLPSAALTIRRRSCRRTSPSPNCSSLRGYATGIIGKWGLGEPRTTGIPNLQGFDYWFGYLDQVHAHNYYPDYLWRNEQKTPLPNVVEKGVATKRVVYSHDLFAAEALEFVDKHQREPFFLYLALTIPHANNEGLLGP